MYDPVADFELPELSEDDERLDEALANTLGNLEKIEQWIRRLDRDRREASGKRVHLRQAIEALLRGAPYEVQRRHDERYARACEVPQAGPKRRTEAMDAVLFFLAEFGRSIVRAADIKCFLEARSIDVGPRYAYKALWGLALDNVVEKIGHGTYAVNHSHPELVSQRLKDFARRKRNWGY